MSAEPRIEPGGRGDVGLFAWGFSQVAGRVTGGKPPHLFLTMGRHPRLFRGWLRFAGRLMPGGKLPRRETELVILRVAHLAGCRYEHDHHVKLGRRAGLTPEEIARTDEGPRAEGWSDRERTLLTAVDELHETRDVSDATWAELEKLYDKRRLIELVMLVAHYEMLATFIGTLRIQPEAAA